MTYSTRQMLEQIKRWQHSNLNKAQLHFIWGVHKSDSAGGVHALIPYYLEPENTLREREQIFGGVQLYINC